MPVLLLVRHGHSTANEAGELAGWRAGVHLTDRGRDQARAAADLVAAAGPVRIVSSPLGRCRETADLLAAPTGVEVEVEPDLGECHYGTWTGRPLKDLAADPLWRVVQDDPENAVFPSSPEHRGESLAQMADRLVAATRAIDAEVEAEHGPDAVWVAVSHGDPIKAVLADAAGAGISRLQRFHVDPGSVSIIRRWGQRGDDGGRVETGDRGIRGIRGDGGRGDRVMVLGTNLRTGSLADLVRSTTPPATAPPGDAVPGGGTG